MNAEHPLELRIATLERQNKQIRRLGLTTLAIVLALFQLSASPTSHAAPTQLRAERFVLTDSNGTERGILELDDNQCPRLVFRDSEGGERLIVAADPQTAYVLLKDQTNKNRLGLAVDGYPHLMLHDEQQSPRIHASVGAKGAPTILLGDGRQFPLGLGIDGDGMIWRKPEIDRELEAKAAAEQEAVERATKTAQPQVEADKPPQEKRRDKR